MKKLTLLFLIALSINSCKLNTQEESEILKFLEITERNFDKNKFEFVQIISIDTIHQTEYYAYASDLVKYNPESHPIDYKIDSPLADYYDAEYKLQIIDVQWLEQPFSKIIYDFIITTDNYVDEYNIPNRFLNSISTMSYQDFKKSLIYNDSYKDKLVENFNNYERFSLIAERNLINKFVKIEKEQDKIVYGIFYKVKYRVDKVLRQRFFLFDTKRKIIEYIRDKKNDI